MTDKLKPKINGQWMPIYLEPVHLSGERFAVAIAAITENMGFYIIQTMPSNLIQVMYPGRSVEMTGLIHVGLISLKTWLKVGGTLERWESPLSGIIKGEIREASGADLNGILEQGVERCSSLSGWR